MVPFLFGGHTLVPLAEGALWWPSRQALLVADLHLEKSSAYARFGMMLPPYDSVETLERLSAIVDVHGAREIWCLGDSFHDNAGGRRLPNAARRLLDALVERVRWFWVAGNHDPEIGGVGGHCCVDAVVDGLALRHRADPREPGPEISGHFHPKLRLAVRGTRIARRCFVHGPNKLVLPAFGTLTGGMDAGDPVIAHAVGRPAAAVVPTANRLLRFALT